MPKGKSGCEVVKGEPCPACGLRWYAPCRKCGKLECDWCDFEATGSTERLICSDCQKTSDR